MSNQYYLCNGSSILLGPVEYNREIIGNALKHHGGSTDDLPESASGAAINVLYLRLLPEIGTTGRPERPEFYHIGQPVLTVRDDHVERRHPVTPYPIEHCSGLLKTAIKKHKRQIINAGITVTDIPVLTSDADRAVLFQTAAAVESGRIESAPWKAPTGWIEATAEQLVPLRNAVELHVQACFQREKQLHDEIETALQDADPHSALLAIDWKRGWPETLNTQINEQGGIDNAE